jgi:hypothetical protein
MTRTLTTYRTTYRTGDDGLSDRTDGDTRTDVETFAPSSGSYVHDGRTIRWHESAARQCAERIFREGMSYGADGGDWFGYAEPYSHPYEDQEEETTAHLTGDWSDTERRAIVRMVEWLDARQAERVAAHFRPSDFGIPERYV